MYCIACQYFKECIFNREIVTAFFLIGPPSAPLSPSFSPQSLTSVDLSWTAIDADCVVKYTIIVTNITTNENYAYNTPTNTTSMTVFDLTQGAEYSFTVAGVDAEGRVGEKSVTSENITLDGKKLYIIMVNYLYEDNKVY